MGYAEDVEEAARRYHLTWCEHPACVHQPFPEDRDHVRSILSIAEPIYVHRDILLAACHHALGIVSGLETDLGRLDDLRAHVNRAHHLIAGAVT